MLIHKLIFLVIAASLFVSGFFVEDLSMSKLIYTGKSHGS